VYLSEQETYQPDLLFITTEHSQIVGEKKIEGAPDLIIEILSPSTAYYDLRHKKEMYARFGVKEYWIVDPPDRILELYVSNNKELVLRDKKKEKGSITSYLFESFALDCIEVFGL
jgi:Uma2 family endonuclease